MKNLLLWGRGGHSRIVEEAAELLGCFLAVHKGDDADNLYDGFGELPWDTSWEVHVAIGDNRARAEVTDRFTKAGYQLATIIHPRAFVSSSATLGPGCYVGPMATVLARAKVGTGVIVNTTASVDHDCVINDFAHIAPGAHLCGTVHVGKRTLIAVGGVVVPKVTIGDDCILGASSALVETIEGNGLKMWGIPARKVE